MLFMLKIFARFLEHRQIKFLFEARRTWIEFLGRTKWTGMDGQDKRNRTHSSHNIFLNILS